MRLFVHPEDAPLYGKHFASMYGGSMFGKPAVVFAVWGYVIALMRPSRKDSQCYVELNPTLLAATFATTIDEILEAIGTLEAPDPGSRSKVEDGRRLVCLSDKSHGPMQFRVVNGQHYRSMRDEEERREYLRVAKQRSRQRQSTKSTGDNHGNPPSTQAEVETDSEVEVDSESTAVVDGMDALSIVQSTAEALLPRKIRVDDFTASLWLRDINPDPWWIAVMLCDAACKEGGLGLAKARKASYLTAVLRDHAGDPLLLAPEDAKFFVERTIASIQRLREAR